MSTDLQDIIAEATIRAFNAGYNQGKSEGYQAGIERALEAAKFVKFEHHDLEVIALSDFEEEVQHPANSYHANRQVTRSEADLEGES
jgi:flagellar biosynthesis/type III secretory pathway protein FliH